jgi:hypothetical protein
VTRARCDSQARQTIYHRSSIGGVLVLLSPTPSPLRGTDPGHRRPATARHRCSLTRSRRAHLQSALVHTNPGDDAILKSP